MNEEIRNEIRRVSAVMMWSESEPKMEHRFQVKFPEYFGLVEFAIHKTNKPKLKYIDGKFVYDDIRFELYDFIGIGILHNIMNGINYIEVNKLKDIDISLEELGPSSDVVETWVLTGMIKEIDFGKLDWNSDYVLSNVIIDFKVNNVKLK